MPEDNLTKIACLGWGSLIWNPRTLPIKGKWFEDGPILPIEFARESSDGRITLVIADVEYSVRSLWCLMDVSNLEEAKIQLADREGVKEKHMKYSIGYWDAKSDKSKGECSSIIKEWGNRKKLEAVVWTNLKYGFKEQRDIMPEYKDVLKHLRELPYEKKKLAEEYIRKSPIQVDTHFRRQLKKDLNWISLI